MLDILQVNRCQEPASHVCVRCAGARDRPDGAVERVDAYGYDTSPPAFDVKPAELGIVTTTRFSYAGTYRAVSAVQRTVPGLPSLTEQRQWNQKGQLTAVGYAGAKTNITYDALNRLTGYHVEGVTPVTFAYDVTGNLTSNGDAAGAAYTYGGAQPHAVTQIGTRGFAYDANGNLVDDGQRMLTWNAANQLAQVTLHNGTTVHHTYDHTGARVQQRVEAVNTYGKPEGWVTYWFSEALEVRVPLLWPAATSGTDPPAGSPPGMAEPPEPTLDTAHATATLHVLVDGQRLASRGITGLVNDPPPDPTAKATAEFLYYHHTDHLGSSHLITEGRASAQYAGLTYPKGSVLQRFEHAAFGQESFALNPNLPFDPRFTGHQYDVDTGLYYFRARYYDPVLARFISPDPVVPDPTDPQDFNRYAYVRNNPLKYVDPSGLITVDDLDSMSDAEVNSTYENAPSFENSRDVPMGYSGPATVGGDRAWAGGGGAPEPSGALHDVTTDAGGTATSTERIPETINITGHRIEKIHAYHLAIDYPPLNDSWISAGPKWTGSHLATTGGFSLVSGRGRKERPSGASELNEVLGTITPPDGKSPREYFQDLIAADTSYCDCLGYVAVPELGLGYNSNSYVSGLIEATGGTPSIDLGRFVGGDKPVPPEHFRW